MEEGCRAELVFVVASSCSTPDEGVHDGRFPGALSTWNGWRFRRKEGIEYAGQGFGRHSNSLVSDDGKCALRLVELACMRH